MSTSSLPTYRVDLVDQLTAIAGDRITAEDYNVPDNKDDCVYLDKMRSTQQTWSIPAGKVAVYSAWSPTANAYLVTSVKHGEQQAAKASPYSAS